MILAMFLALQAAPAPTPALLPADDIVVIARRLQNWRAAVTMRKGAMTCTTKQSSGDPEIDRIGCAAMNACWPTVAPQFEATRDKALTNDERKAMAAAANGQLTKCVNGGRMTLIADLAKRRAAARSDT